MNNKAVYIIAGAALLLGSVGSIAIQAYAQNSTPTTTPVVQTQNSTQNQATVNDPKDLPGSDTDNVQDNNQQSHKPLGGDGVVSSVNSSMIVMSEESDEGSVSYTVDASKATVTNNGVSAQLSDIKVGDKIFVEGPVTGTTVAATSISLGHPNFKGHEDGTNDGETNDDRGTSSSTSSN